MAPGDGQPRVTSNLLRLDDGRELVLANTRRGGLLYFAEGREFVLGVLERAATVTVGVTVMGATERGGGLVGEPGRTTTTRQQRGENVMSRQRNNGHPVSREGGGRGLMSDGEPAFKEERLDALSPYAGGKTVNENAKKPFLSHRGAEYRLDQTRNALGARSWPEAVVKAALQGLLTPVPDAGGPSP